MKINLYSIKDNKAGLFTSPFGQNNDQVALRSLKLVVNSPNNSFVYRHPEDASMYQIGTFDDSTGEITSEIKFIINAVDVKEVVKEGDFVD